MHVRTVASLVCSPWSAAAPSTLPRKGRNWPRLLNLTIASVSARCVKHHGVGEDELTSLVACLDEPGQACTSLAPRALQRSWSLRNFRCSPDASSIRVPRTEAFSALSSIMKHRINRKEAGVLAGPFRVSGARHRMGVLSEHRWCPPNREFGGAFAGSREGLTHARGRFVMHPTHGCCFA